MADWKVGDEFAPYYPQASHVNPDWRDGWNACHTQAAALLRQQAERITELEKEALAKPFAPDWAGYRQGLEDGKREGQAERDQLRAEVERLRKICVEQAQSLIERPVMAIDTAQKEAP